jgi:hypothetical protein
VVACGCRIMVLPQPSKLMTRVRFPPPAPLFIRVKLLLKQAHVAQSVEHFLGKEEVTGSIPVMSSSFELKISVG